MQGWLEKHWQEALKVVRDTSFWLLGLYLAYEEVTSDQPEKISDIILIGGLLGLPLAFRQDEKKAES